MIIRTAVIDDVRQIDEIYNQAIDMRCATGDTRYLSVEKDPRGSLAILLISTLFWWRNLTAKLSAGSVCARIGKVVKDLH